MAMTQTSESMRRCKERSRILSGMRSEDWRRDWRKTRAQTANPFTATSRKRLRAGQELAH